MKKLLLGVIVFTPLLFSCDPRSGGAGGGGPIEPPPTTVAAKIQSVSPVAPSFVLTGMPVNTGVTFTVSATGNPTPTYAVNGIAMSGNSYVAPASYESKSYDFTVSNSAGSDLKKVNITIAVDPTFAKLAGTSMAGRSFRMISAVREPIGGGTPVNIMTSCWENDVFTFYPDLTNQTNYGSGDGCPTGMSGVYKYQFDASNPDNMLLRLIDVIPAQPDRKVEFPSSTTMVHSYDLNGFRYTFGFQAQ